MACVGVVSVQRCTLLTNVKKRDISAQIIVRLKQTLTLIARDDYKNTRQLGGHLREEHSHVNAVVGEADTAV